METNSEHNKAMKAKLKRLPGVGEMLAEIPSCDLQMICLRRAIRRTDDNILSLLNSLDDMRSKQRHRQRELAKLMRKSANVQAEPRDP